MGLSTILVILVIAFVSLLFCNLVSVHRHILLNENVDEAKIRAKQTQVYLFDPASSSLSGINMWELRQQWTRHSDFDVLLRLAPADADLHPKQALPATDDNRALILWHAVPKTAGTTVRKAIFKHIADTCPPSGMAATQQGAFRHVPTLHEIMRDCVHTHYYGLGGRITFQPLKNTTIIHTIAFRPYEDWARSALNQIVKTSGIEHCQIVRDHLSECDDYRELSFYQYTKTQLERILRYSLSKRDIVVIYNYKDTDLFHSTLGTQLELPPLKLEVYNTNRTTLECPNDVLDRFFRCHDL